MTGQDIQDRLDAIVEDLQTTGKGKTVNVLLREANNDVAVFDIGSDNTGTIPQAQIDSLQAFVDVLKPIADAYETAREPVTDAGEAYRAAREPHQALIDAASAARTALNNALEADQNYQDALNAYNEARQDPDYISARDAYQAANVSENYGNLGDAKGKYMGS